MDNRKIVEDYIIGFLEEMLGKSNSPEASLTLKDLRDRDIMLGATVLDAHDWWASLAGNNWAVTIDKQTETIKFIKKRRKLIDTRILDKEPISKKILKKQLLTRLDLLEAKYLRKEINKEEFELKIREIEDEHKEILAELKSKEPNGGSSTNTIMEENILGILSIILWLISFVSILIFFNSPLFDIYLAGIILGGLGIKFDRTKIVALIGLLLNIGFLVLFSILSLVSTLQLLGALQNIT